MLNLTWTALLRVWTGFGTWKQKFYLLKYRNNKKNRMFSHLELELIHYLKNTYNTNVYSTNLVKKLWKLDLNFAPSGQCENSFLVSSPVSLLSQCIRGHLKKILNYFSIQTLVIPFAFWLSICICRLLTWVELALKNKNLIWNAL